MERLEADKAKYVRQHQVIARHVGSRLCAWGSRAAHPAPLQRAGGPSIAGRQARPPGQWRATARPDSLIFYRQKRDCRLR